MGETEIGKIFKYFAEPGVAALEIEKGTLKVGDRIHIVGATTDLEQTVESMQIEKNAVKEVKAGDSVGIKVLDRVRPNDKIFKIVD